ncbi:nuclear transport factor 2 family protein [Nonomuraea sp. NPDC050691]|uniref:nuclear transport factor 2 family protein n=1 Tax=Nonomuraea sp. NPDC050691 TaxID=3155661 RepID=UPI0033CA57A8
MRKRAIVGAAAAVLVAGGVAAGAGSDFQRAVATDAIQPLPSAPASRGPLDPAARRYLDAVAAGDADALAAGFAPDGLVIDVGREIRGRDAIRRWAADEVIGGVYTLLDHTPRPGGVTMLVRFQPGGVGGFRANYHFDITDGLITKATLEYA